MKKHSTTVFRRSPIVNPPTPTRRSVIRRVLLTTWALAAFSPGAARAQSPTGDPLPDDSAGKWTGTPRALDRPSPVTLSLVGTAGSAVGLTLGFLGGTALGQRVGGGDRQDHALGTGALGALIGSGLGTALGLGLASDGRLSTRQAAQVAFFGMLAGITGWALSSSALDSTGGLVIAYSLPQGVVAGAFASAVLGDGR